MIVSHEHKFIFLKTRKTAGTSIEVFLARHLGTDAVITAVSPEIEGHRPQHDRDWFNPIPQILHQRRLRPALRDLRSHRSFYNHISATRVRERVGTKVWNSYFKFCFERDPWEKTLSWYYFQLLKRPRLDFEEFVRTEPLPTDLGAYSVRGRIAMDFVGKFESLTSDLAHALDHVGIHTPIELTHEKGGVRPALPRADATYTSELNTRVALVFAREIAEFGYEDRSLRSLGH